MPKWLYTIPFSIFYTLFEFLISEPCTFTEYTHLEKKRRREREGGKWKEGKGWMDKREGEVEKEE